MALYHTVKDHLPLYKGKRVFVRVDFNVPQDKRSYVMTDATRVEAAVPTLKNILEAGGKLVLASHLGKPQKELKSGKTLDELKRTRSLEIVVGKLSALLGRDVIFVRDYLEQQQLPDADVVLLENTRFSSAEESKDDTVRQKMAQTLATFADYYVCDAFGTAHRKHSSVYELTLLFKGRAAAGYLMEKEIEALDRIVNLQEKDKPFGAILGGAKVEDKIKVIENLYPKVHTMAIIGAMEFAFDKAQGREIGDSLCEGVEVAKGLIGKGYTARLYTPEDVVIARKTDSGYGDVRTVDIADGIPKGYAGLDIGEKGIEEVKRRLSGCKTIFWNGPAGLFEVKPFDIGTRKLAEFLAGMKDKAVVIVGGGDSVTAVNLLGLQDQFYHVSTGGGASLEMLELKPGEYLPAVDALIKAK